MKAVSKRSRRIRLKRELPVRERKRVKNHKPRDKDDNDGFLVISVVMKFQRLLYEPKLVVSTKAQHEDVLTHLGWKQKTLML